MSTPHEPSFATTHWSVVVSAGHRSSPESDQALADLCQRYWFPLYAYIRRRVANAEDARDLTQEFFARLLEKNLLAAAQPARGRFRSFLLTCCQNFLANAWDRAAAQKRGGGNAPLPLDFSDGESRYRVEPVDRWTPERLFERQWTITLLGRVLDRLRGEHIEAGKIATFEQLSPFLAGTPQGTSQAEAAESVGLTEAAFKMALHGLRKRYRDLLGGEVGQTLDAGEDVQDEIRALFRSFGG
jgi:RNA polymerase sigma factor (sigma-70 family)